MGIISDEFYDDPDTGGIPPSEKGAADGVATLDSGGKIPLSEIPASVTGGLTYQGTWSAATNTPTLANTDTGKQGYYYRCNVAGSVDFGAGSISFNIGDMVVNDGTVWDKWDVSDDVTSVFSRNGDVVAAASDYDASQIDNDSGVTGAFVDDALNTLNAGKVNKAYNLSLSNLSYDAKIMVLTAGAVQSVWGNICMMQSDGEVDPADASAEATGNGFLVFATETKQSASGTFVVEGIVRDDTWTWTPGLPIYLSETTGAMTQTPPTTTNAIVRVVGYAITATIILFDPDGTYIKRS